MPLRHISTTLDLYEEMASTVIGRFRSMRSSAQRSAFVNHAIDSLAEASAAKLDLLDRSWGRYFVSSMMAGVYVGIGVILILSVGAPLYAAGSPALRLAMGASFGVALTLVIFAGSELFTGNNMIMTVGCLRGRIGVRGALRASAICYAGNLTGALALAGVMAMSGLATGTMGTFLNSVASAKMNAPAGELFIRGVLCNMLICLAIWMASRTKSDAAKLVLIFWCLFAFIASGFEHSVANMTLLGLSLLVSHDATISWAGFAANLLPVTAGNVVGGAIFIGAAYAYVASPPKKKAAAAEAIEVEAPLYVACQKFPTHPNHERPLPGPQARQADEPAMAEVDCLRAGEVPVTGRWAGRVGVEVWP